MSNVVQNDWKWDTARLKSELDRLINDFGSTSVSWERGSLNGISLTSQDGTLESGFNIVSFIFDKLLYTFFFDFIFFIRSL